MRRIILSIIFLGGFYGFSQTEKSLTMDPSYTKKVFYSFENGEVGSMRNDNWDIAFAVYTTQTAAIRINGGFGAELYQYTGGDTAEWATLDTAGLNTLTNWTRNRDDQSAYEPSAFEAQATGHPNYGWGEYNNITHNVVGTKLFVVKTVAGDYKKVWIKEQKAIGNTITIKVANLDNTLEYTKTIDKSVGFKNYLYFNLVTEAVMDNEPSNQTYDIVFTKYEGMAGPTSYYPLTGVVLTRGVGAAEMRDVPVADADLTQANFVDDIDVIGSDWKSFNMTSFQWELPDSLSYFVEDLAGNIWHLWFTDWEGSTTGNLMFMQNKVVSASAKKVNSNTNFKIYPNPAVGFVQLDFSTEVLNAFESIAIVDVTGRTVFESFQLQNIQNQPISTTNFDKGLYFVQLKGTETITQKLVVK